VKNQLPADRVGPYMERKVVQTVVNAPRAMQAAMFSAINRTPAGAN
jgi:hypothetical protein